MEKQRKGPRVEEMEAGISDRTAGDADKRDANNPGSEEDLTLHLQQQVG